MRAVLVELARDPPPAHARRPGADPRPPRPRSHPDKIKVGPNETREDVDNKFVELTKAYKSLTDDAVRENLKLYGNPDGPQQREDIVAIPKWIVEGSNGGWVLAVYGLVFGGLMPWLVVRLAFSPRASPRERANARLSSS